MTGRTASKAIRRPATRADLEAWFQRDIPMTVRAVVWEIDGKVVGLAGRYRAGGQTVVFSEALPDLPKFAIWREAKKFMAEIKAPAICATEGAGPFLERLGWVKGEDEVYLWQA